MSVSSTLKTALLATSLLFLAPAAFAQDSDRAEPTAYSPDTETIIVTAPNFREEPGSVPGLPGKTMLSRSVPYDDLD